MDGIINSVDDGHEFEQILRDSEEQGSLVCCSPWGHKESDATEQQQKRNVFESILLRWMNLDPAIQSEVSQKEKHFIY